MTLSATAPGKSFISQFTDWVFSYESLTRDLQYFISVYRHMKLAQTRQPESLYTPHHLAITEMAVSQKFLKYKTDLLAGATNTTVQTEECLKQSDPTLDSCWPHSTSEQRESFYSPSVGTTSEGPVNVSGQLIET